MASPTPSASSSLSAPRPFLGQRSKSKRHSHGRGPLIRTPSAGGTPEYSRAYSPPPTVSDTFAVSGNGKDIVNGDGEELESDERTPLLNNTSEQSFGRDRDAYDEESGTNRLKGSKTPIQKSWKDRHWILTWTMRFTFYTLLILILLLIPILHLSLGQILYEPVSRSPSSLVSVTWTPRSEFQVAGAGKGRTEIVLKKLGLRVREEELPKIVKVGLWMGRAVEGRAKLEARDVSVAAWYSLEVKGEDGENERKEVEVAKIKVKEMGTVVVGDTKEEDEELVDVKVEVEWMRNVGMALEDVGRLLVGSLSEDQGKDVKLRGRVEGLRGSVGVKGWRVGGWDVGVHIKGFSVAIQGQVPKLPPLPEPASLVRLVSYDFKMDNSSLSKSSSTNSGVTEKSKLFKDKLISLSAKGILINPLHPSTNFSKGLPPFLRNLDSLKFDVPWTFPFGLYFPIPNAKDDFLLAKVATEPWIFDNRFKEFNLSLGGWVEPIKPSKEIEDVVSRFLSRYLRREPNEVVFRYDTTERTPGKNVPPEFVVDVLGKQELRYNFPGAKERLHLLEDVHIQDMKLSLGKGGTEIRASGKVVGHLNLPQALKSFEPQSNITAIWPDIYVYDGETPSGPSDYPPDPTPENAFGRLRTPDFAPATTSHTYDKDGNLYSEVTAFLDDIPLEVLDGRGDVFRGFMSKVIFGKGSQAGIKGKADVRVAIEGITKSGLAVKGVDVEGSFWVGKK